MKLQRLGLTTLFSLLTTLTLTDHPKLFFWESLQIGNGVFAQTATEEKAEADRLLDQAEKQYNTSQYQAAIQSLESALKIYREIGDRNGERFSLMGLGSAYNYLGQYQKAIEFYQHLQTTKDKAQALRQAMLTVKKTNPNPKDWSGFILMGESF